MDKPFAELSKLFNVISGIHFLSVLRIGRCLQNGFLIGTALYHRRDKGSETILTKCSAFYYADRFTLCNADCLAFCNTDCFALCNTDCLTLCHADCFTFPLSLCSCIFCNNLQGFLFIVFGQQHVDHLTFL